MGKIETTFYRNKIKESVHSIKCLISSYDGEIIYTTKNENDLIYPRSSIKIFQAIPFACSNAVKSYNLNQKQIALSCSSTAILSKSPFGILSFIKLLYLSSPRAKIIEMGGPSVCLT